MDLEDWISDLEGLRTEIESIKSLSAISEKDFMVKILNNLPSEYDIVLDGLKNRLMLTGSVALTVTVCCKIVRNEIFKYPISGSEKYQNEFPTPKYVGIDTLIIIME